jgi:hypothetical protein
MKTNEALARQSAASTRRKTDTSAMRGHCSLPAKKYPRDMCDTCM